MVEEVDDHRHCVVCGKPTPPGEFICSKECEEKLRTHQERVSRRNKLHLVFIVALVVAVIALAFAVG